MSASLAGARGGVMVEEVAESVMQRRITTVDAALLVPGRSRCRRSPEIAAAASLDGSCASLTVRVGEARDAFVLAGGSPVGGGGHPTTPSRVRDSAAGQDERCRFPRCRSAAVGVCTLCGEATCETHIPKHWNVRLYAAKGDPS